MSTATDGRQVEAVLRRGGRLTAREVALEARTSVGKARTHLRELLVQGLVLRELDTGTPSPRGGTYRWGWLEVPLGEPTPTDLVLCLRCQEEVHGDSFATGSPCPRRPRGAGGRCSMRRTTVSSRCIGASGARGG